LGSSPTGTRSSLHCSNTESLEAKNGFSEMLLGLIDPDWTHPYEQTTAATGRYHRT
jgi:hypothetical protein